MEGTNLARNISCFLSSHRSVPLTQAPTMMPSAVWWWRQKFLTKAGQKPVPCLWTSKTVKQINVFPDNVPGLRCFVIATENG